MWAYQSGSAAPFDPRVTPHMKRPQVSRKCLKRADFADAMVATQDIEGFMTSYNIHMAHPFEWKKGVRFYKRLKDKLAARPELPLAACMRNTGNYDPDSVL